MIDNEKDVGVSQLRSFGLIVGSIFAVIAVWPLIIHGQDLRVWSLILSGLLVIPALVIPTILRPVFRVWMRIGSVLGWINTRIILAIGFYLVFTPIGVIMRIVGKDPLHRKFHSNITTYRVSRTPRADSHMQNQY